MTKKNEKQFQNDDVMSSLFATKEDQEKSNRKMSKLRFSQYLKG